MHLALKFSEASPRKMKLDYVPGRISVIIPSFNYDAYILDAVHSAFRQGVDDLEIIVVDDGSTDNTKKYLKAYRNKIKYIFQENAGLSAARNTGIKNSSGEFILFLDADDILGPGTIAFQLKYLEYNTNAGVVVCQNRFFKKTTPAGCPKTTGRWRLFKKNLDVHLCCFNIAPPHAFLYRRKAILKAGWFDIELNACEDYDFLVKVAMGGNIPHYNPTGLVYYRRHPESMSANLRNQYLHDAILHSRLSTLLDQYPRYPEGQRLEGLLAFSSGVLLTASRLHSLQLEGVNDLIDLALKRIEDAREIVGSGNGRWNVVAKLYALRIFLHLTHPCFRDSAKKAEIIDNLRDIMETLKAPSSKLGLIADGLFSTRSESLKSIGERAALVQTALKYIRNYIFELIFIRQGER